MSWFDKSRVRTKKIAVRTLRTMAQTAGGVLGTSGVLHGIDWGLVLSTTILAGLVCALMHLGGEA